MRIDVLAVAALMLSACKLTEAPVPAVLEAGDASAVEALKTSLSEALGRANVELGPGDPTANPTISALPPKPGLLEGRSLAKPTIFDLVIENGSCVLIQRDTGATYPLTGVGCRPA